MLNKIIKFDTNSVVRDLKIAAIKHVQKNLNSINLVHVSIGEKDVVFMSSNGFVYDSVSIRKLRV